MDQNSICNPTLETLVDITFSKYGIFPNSVTSAHTVGPEPLKNQKFGFFNKIDFIKSFNCFEALNLNS